MATPANKTNDPDSKSRPARPTAAYFPLGYKEAIHQWWNIGPGTTAERRVLSLVPYLKDARELAAAAGSDATSDSIDADPFGPRVWKSQMVPLSGKNRALNEYMIERVGEDVEDNLVCLHGYGAGLGFFYKNFEPLTRLPGWRLYALDMLGMGNSSRPPFNVSSRDKSKDARIDEAEAWFVDALEEWRRIRGIDKFTLMGHSLGGYLSVAYALKYPGHLKKLILASPVGVPADPYAVNEAMPEPGASTLENEFTQDQESVMTTTKYNSSDKDKSAANAQVKATELENKNIPASQTTATNARRRPLPGWFVWLWDANVSPFSIVRFTGPLGPRFVSGWTSRRFNHLPEDESKALHDYSFSIFRQRGSGEYALPYILAPGAFARRPVIDRIEGVGRQVFERRKEVKQEQERSSSSDPENNNINNNNSQIESSIQKIRETGIPIVMMYGENDWMDVAGGLAAVEKLKDVRVKALLRGTDEEKRRENGSAKVVVVQKAGHHLYLDNADEFNEAIRKEMEETRAQGRKGLV